MNILLIYTGGTIGMVQNAETGALESFDFQQLQQHVPELYTLGHHIDVHTFQPPIDSSDMTPDHWLQLRDIILESYDRYDGFVVLHGTDTMAFTASALSFLLPGLTKPVIFTGSQLPVSQVRTDGRENLITAVEMAADTDAEGRPRVPEVCIYFERKLLRGNRATKINAEGFNAFRTHNFPPLATAGTHIIYKAPLAPPQGGKWGMGNSDKGCALQLSPKGGAGRGLGAGRGPLCTDIVVVTLFPGMSEEMFAAQVSAPALRAVILRTFGSGNAPQRPWLLNQLNLLRQRGVIVVNITQCDEGSVEMGRYQTSRLLLEAGVVPGYDSTWEAMLTKLMVLLACDLSREEVISLLLQSLAGEITPS